MSHVIVTTGDLHQPYEILGPVCVQISNKGQLTHALSLWAKSKQNKKEDSQNQNEDSANGADSDSAAGQLSSDLSNFEQAFIAATEKLKKRGEMVSADAIICMRQNITMDENAIPTFYMHLYGTAVKFID